MNPAKLNLPIGDSPGFYRSNTVPQITIILSEKNVGPLDLSGATAKMQWRTPSGTLVKTFSTADNTILIPNPQTDGKIIIPQFNCDCIPGIHVYDLEVTQGTEVNTYLEGYVTVLPDVTQ